MKKIYVILFMIVTMFNIISCKEEIKYENLNYRFVTKKNIPVRDYFGIFSGDKLVYKNKNITGWLKYKDNKCFALSEKWKSNRKYCVGFYFVDGKLKTKMKGISNRFYISSDFKYLIYYEYDVNQTHTEYDYKTIIIRDTETGKILNKWTFSEIIKNKDIMKLYEWIYKENSDSIEIILKDSWGEVFEHFVINLNNYDLTRIPVNYSKTDPEMIKKLPSVH